MAARASLCFKSLGTLLLLFVCLSSFAQTANLRGIGPVSPRARITQAVDPSRTVPLKGNVHPLARAQYDRGAAPDSLPADRMLLVLQRSAEQQAALDQLLEEQHTKGSPNYHHWLTPQEFGATFGPAESDVNVITNWLTSQGFQVNNVAAARNVIEFSGTAGQVRQAFGTQIHEYDVEGRQHFANATNPQIPEALAPVVVGVDSMNSFRRKPMSHRIADVNTVSSAAGQPLLTGTCTDSSGKSYTCYEVVPYDFATIYNVLPQWNNSINGTGQSIAIVGRSNIDPAEVAFFRSKFGLPPNPPHITLNGPDPGIVNGEAMEAYLDVEWSGAVAPQAAINLVVSDSTATTDGVDLSSQYIVDHNLSPVMSVSFGSCESGPLGMTAGSRAFYNSLWEQAAAQGITVSVSTGDNGSAGCDDPTNNGASTFVAASGGVAVNGLASTPFNVGLGGTDFNQTSATVANYWGTSNNTTTRASALGYIPETTWNDSCAQSGTLGQSTANCSTSTISANGIWAGSGGRSAFYSKPSWQMGSGVPADGKRDLPDISLFSATGGNLSSYLICDGKCTTSSSFGGVGGTSAAAPAFAGIMALVNQKTGSRQGNANIVLYNLASKQTYSNCASTSVAAGNSCTFYDVTLGNIDVPCKAGTLNCGTSGTLVDPSATSNQAWPTKASYDLATGLGSINVNNLITNWSNATFTPTTTTITSTIPTGLTHGATTNVTVSVSPTSGSGTPTGDVVLIAKYSDGTPENTFDLATLPSGQKIVTFPNVVLPGGTYTLVAHYLGDGTYGASDSDGTPVTVNAQNSQTIVKLIAFDASNNAFFSTSVTYGSPYILRMWVTSLSDAITSPAQDSICASTDTSTCATGHITLKDGVNLLDGGDFILATVGSVEDPLIQLDGGQHTVTAAYLGDHSYNPSSATATLTINKATTTIGAPTNPGSVTTGTNVNISATAQASSNGAAPTGSITFFDGSTQINGTVTYTPTNGDPTSANPVASLKATITTQFTTAGTHQITAQYNGDINYTGTSKSPATAVTVTQAAGPATHFSVTAPATATTSTSFNVTVTALDANNATATSYTGTVHFTSNDAAATMPPDGTLTNGTGSFRATLNTVGTFAITATDTVTASIAGMSGNITVTAPTPDFTMSAAPASGTVVKGSSGTSTITVASTNGFAATVALTCAVTPVVSKGPTCSVSPSSVNPTSATPATPTLTVATTANTIAALHKGFGWTLAGTSGVFAFVLLGIPGLRRRANTTVLMLLLGLMLVGGTVACGGGSNGGGGTTITGTPSGTYTVTVTGTSGSLTHTTTYTVTVP